MKNHFLRWGIINMLLVFSITAFGQFTDDLDRSDAPGIEAYSTASLKSGVINKTFKVHIVFASNKAGISGAYYRSKIISAMNGLFKTQTGVTFIYNSYEIASSSSLSISNYKYGQVRPDCFIVLVRDGNCAGSLGYPVIQINSNVANNWPQDTREHLIAHELGHTFGLQHTFYGSKYNFGSCTGVYGELDDNCNPVPYGDGTSQCRETYNSSNGLTCGDFCSDTGGDPGSGVMILENNVDLYPLSHFSGTSTNTDPNNHPYTNLPVQNIMSYYGCENSVFTTQQKQIMHNIADCDHWSRLKSTFTYSVIPSDMFTGDEATVSLNISSESKHISQSIGLSYATGYNPNNVTCVQYNNGSTADLEVIGTNAGTEELRFHILYPRVYGEGFHTIRQKFNININPPVIVYPPTISYPYNMNTDYYVANPLETGILYRFQMNNCGSSNTNTDFEWTASAYGDILFKDINGSIVSDEETATAYGKTCYVEGYEEDEVTLKARYRVNSSLPWSEWKVKQLYFENRNEMMMMMSPNPASFYDETTISLESVTEDPIDYDEGWEIEIVDINYAMKIKEKVKKKEYKLKTQGWKAGTYIVIATYKDKRITGKLKVE